MQLRIGLADEVNGGTIDTAKDLYDLFMFSTDTHSQPLGWSDCFESTMCEYYFVEKLGCHQWRVTDNSGGLVGVLERIQWSSQIQRHGVDKPGGA